MSVMVLCDEEGVDMTEMRELLKKWMDDMKITGYSISLISREHLGLVRHLHMVIDSNIGPSDGMMSPEELLYQVGLLGRL